jgi:hypothetical protein
VVFIRGVRELGIGDRGSGKGEREKGDKEDKGDKGAGESGRVGEWESGKVGESPPHPFTPSPFKGRVFKISKIVEKILKCFTWFGCFRIFKSAEMVKKLPNTKSLPLKAPPHPLSPDHQPPTTNH